MELLQAGLSFLNTIPSEAWNILAEVIVGALAVSPVMLAIKKWLSIDGEKKMMFLVIFGSMLASAGLYLRGIPQFAPWFVAVQGTLVFAFSQPVYYLFVKPLYRKLGASLTVQINKAKDLNEAKTAAVPAGGLPVPTTPQVIEDFSH